MWTQIQDSFFLNEVNLLKLFVLEQSWGGPFMKSSEAPPHHRKKTSLYTSKENFDGSQKVLLGYLPFSSKKD